MRVETFKRETPRPEETALHFKNVRDALRFIEPSFDVIDHAGIYMPSRDRLEKKRGAFNHAPSFDDAVPLMRRGWREGKEKLISTTAHLERIFRDTVVTPTFYRDVEGIEPDVGAFLAGEPEHMLNYRHAQHTAKHVNIVVDVNVRCSACGRRHHDYNPTPSGWVLTRGGAVLLLLKALRLARYTFDLKVRTTTYYNYAKGRDIRTWPPGPERILSIEVPVARSDTSPDFDMLAFALAHEDFVRCLLWRVEEWYHWHTLDLGPPTIEKASAIGPGAMRYFREYVQQFVGWVPVYHSHEPKYQTHLEPGDVNLPSIPYIEDAHLGTGQFDDAENAVTWVADQLTEQGVVLK